MTTLRRFVETRCIRHKLPPWLSAPNSQDKTLRFSYPLGDFHFKDRRIDAELSAYMASFNQLANLAEELISDTATLTRNFLDGTNDPEVDCIEDNGSVSSFGWVSGFADHEGVPSGFEMDTDAGSSETEKT